MLLDLSDVGWDVIPIGLTALLFPRGWCVVGSMPILVSFFLICVFQWFFISLSVLPGNLAAIFEHLNIQMQDIRR